VGVKERLLFNTIIIGRDVIPSVAEHKDTLLSNLRVPPKVPMYATSGSSVDNLRHPLDIYGPQTSEWMIDRPQVHVPAFPGHAGRYSGN
jgi:hypothetical protein